MNEFKIETDGTIKEIVPEKRVKIRELRALIETARTEKEFALVTVAAANATIKRCQDAILEAKGKGALED